MSFREFPVYVPAGEDRLCGVVSAPDGEARDLGVVLLTGGNFTRTHTNRMWVHAARELAERGFASIRIDYHGVGDSTGEAHYELETPFDGDVLAASDFLLRAMGTDRLTLVATCFGGRSAIAAAAQDPRVRSMTIYPIPVLIPRGQRQPGARLKAKAWLRGSAWGERILGSKAVRRIRRKAARRRGDGAGGDGEASDVIVSPRLKRDIVTFARRGGSLRFIFGELDPNLPGIRQALQEIEPHTTPRDRERIELQVVPGVDLHGYARILDQDTVIRMAVASVEEDYRSLAGAVPDEVTP